MRTVIKENNWLTRGFIDFGWGNGYVLIPKGHPLHGKSYHDIDVDIHYGLTFSELVDDKIIDLWKLNKEDMGMWCVGFDTAHSGDNLSKWPKEAVQAEADNLLQQLVSYKINGDES